MSDKQVMARIVGKFDGTNVTAKGVVDLKFKLPYDEILNYIKTLQMLNNNINVTSQIVPNPELDLGIFMIKSLNIGGDGEAKFCLTTTTVSAEMDNVNKLSSDIGANVVITLTAAIEPEDEELEEDWPEDEEEETAAGDWQDNTDVDEYIDNESWDDVDENERIPDGWE